MSDHFKNFDELFRNEDDERTPQQRPTQQRPVQQRPAQQPQQAWPEREATRPVSPDVEPGWDAINASPRGRAPQNAPQDEWDFFDTPVRRRGETPEGAEQAPTPEQPGAAENVRAAGAQRREEPDAVEEYPDVDDDWEQIDPPIRKRRDGKSGCLGGLIYFAFVVSVSIILACVGWMAASDVLALNKEPITATVTLDKAEFEETTQTVTNEDGTTKERKVRKADIGYVADLLKDAGIIEYKGLFRFYCSISHAQTKIDPGTYELNTNYDYRALVKKMQVGSGAMVTTNVTFPEGYSMKQIFEKLEEEGVCEYDDLMEAAANYQYNYSFLDENALGDASRLEGFLFPDTYEFYQGMQASSAINKFLVNFHDRLTAEMLEQAESAGLSLKQVVTIASMIEKEAANDDERAVIASVIFNRLKADMPLQIDATVMYAMTEHKDYLTEADTQIDSPYNTYLNKGLPPTPIANPGAASLKAVLKPADTHYLYYALDTASGTHKFFTNYSEFQAFVATQDYTQ